MKTEKGSLKKTETAEREEKSTIKTEQLTATQKQGQQCSEGEKKSKYKLDFGTKTENGKQKNLTHTEQ